MDASDEAKSSVSMRGIGGDKSSMMGRGPMVISVRDEQGVQMYMIDPAEVYLDKASLIGGIVALPLRNICPF
jgi:hypothetical protein